jgi:hypothetical protein
LLAFNNASAISIDFKLKEKQLFFSSTDRLDTSIVSIQFQKRCFEIHVEHPDQKDAVRLSKRRNSDDHFSIIALNNPSQIPVGFFVKITDHPKHGIVPSSIRQSSYYGFLFRLCLF